MKTLQRLVARLSDDKVILRVCFQSNDNDTIYWISANLSTPVEILERIGNECRWKRNRDSAVRTLIILADESAQ